jgi:hypothetical protein
MISVFGNVFRLSGGESVWANVFVLDDAEASVIVTRIGTLVGASKAAGTISGASRMIGSSVGASKRIGTLSGTNP